MVISAKIAFAFLVSLTWYPFALLVQIPQDIPHQTEPVDFTESGNVWFYLGVPLLMLVLYIIIRKVRRNRQEP